MPVQRSQGKRRPQCPRVDELPLGVPSASAELVSASASAAGAALRAGGDTAAAAELGRLGGLAKAAQDRGLRVLEGLGLKGVAPANLAPYLADAEAFAEAEIARLAAEVGGGVCGPMPASMVQSAALELAGSRAAYAAGDTSKGSRFAAASRQNCLSAREMCALDAQARKRANPESSVPAWVKESRERFGSPSGSAPVEGGSSETQE